MIDYLSKLGFTPSIHQSTSTQLYAINNADGSPRWIWNATNPRPDFLRFYSVANLRSKVFSYLIRLIFLLKLQHLFFKKNSWLVDRDEAHLLASFTQHNFALFTGTEGPNRKLVLYANQQFVKIALNETSAKLIEAERQQLQQLKSGNHVEIPAVNQLGQGMVSLSDLGKNGERKSSFSALHAKALQELQNQFPIQSAVFKSTEAYQKNACFFHPNQGPPLPKLPFFLQEKLTMLADSMAQKELLFTWAHGDFTPWNCFVADNKTRVYDFELAQAQLPFGFDAFHFVMQQGILVDRLPWKEIKPQLKTAFDLLKKPTQRQEVLFETSLNAYLLINTAYYLRLYSQQAKWHEQINWLLNTWNDALSDVLTEQETHRPLLISDVFDFLHNQDYATVKFPLIHPSNLSEYADIDLLTTKKTAQDLLAYLKQHSLVKSLKVDAQSHMKSLLVQLHNGQLLALDLIWQLKRKSLEFMSVPNSISGAEVNNFGIKALNQADTTDYLRFFYGLNGSSLPEKYSPLFGTEALVTFKREELTQEVQALPLNKGISGWINKVNYALDVLRKPFGKRGLIITFSGVDGAGKSTLIEHTKKIVEKKLRRKVVVIRHRPSVLPILSALTMGKAKAEQKAATTLPRQGTNTSLFSSLFRFGYYYLDYLLGQFYIYAKHVLRGEVVLYDRYYFDFINDSLRSNIRLPKWLTKAGYNLLLQPTLNFFLYADAQTILSRKKELDAVAITQLTHDYLALFSELEAQSPGKYFPIENLQLHQSLQFITAKITAEIC